MVHLSLFFALATLADGKTVMNKVPGDSDMPWTAMSPIQPEPMKVCSSSSETRYTNVLAALTYDDRILISCCEPSPEFEDVTPAIRILTGSDTSSIRDICVVGGYVIFWTDFSIGLVDWRIDSEFSYGCVFQSEIDRVWVDDCRCVVRTKDNCIFAVSNTKLTIPPACQLASELGKPFTLENKSEIAFHDVEGIAEVYGGTSWILFLMKDGSVYGCDYEETSMNHKPFSRVLLPEGEIVTRIVNTQSHIVYVTASNNYYKQHMTHKNNWATKPVLMQKLSSYVVESILAGPRCSIIVQYRDPREQSPLHTCIIHSTYNSSYEGELEPVSFCYADQLQPLPSLSNKIIVSIIHRGYLTCFVMDDGSVCWSHFMHYYEPVAISDPFFDSNPVAAEGQAVRIRSAGSIVEHKTR